MGNSDREPPTVNGCPIPVTLEEVKGCFDRLASVVAIESVTIAELVKNNAAPAASNATLTTSNAKLTKALAKSKGGGGGDGDGGGKRGEEKY